MAETQSSGVCWHHLVLGEGGCWQDLLPVWMKVKVDLIGLYLTTHLQVSKMCEKWKISFPRRKYLLYLGESTSVGLSCSSFLVCMLRDIELSSVPCLCQSWGVDCPVRAWECVWLTSSLCWTWWLKGRQDGTGGYRVPGWVRPCLASGDWIVSLAGGLILGSMTCVCSWAENIVLAGNIQT